MRFQVLALTAFVSAAVAAPPQHAHAAAIYHAKRGVAEGHKNYHTAARRAGVAVTAAPAPHDGGAACEAGAPCTGEVTHYDAVIGDYGACGRNDIDGKVFLGVSMPHLMMGDQSNGNPYCGLSVTVTNPATGASVVGTVIDKCMGCDGRNVDLTDAMFNAVAAGVDGRGYDFTWHLN